MLEYSFDEYDPETQLPLVKLMSKFAKDIYPAIIDIDGKKLYRHIAYDDESVIQHALTMVDECMGSLYVSHKGEDWKVDKEEELQEVGLLYVWYSFAEDTSAPPRALVVNKVIEGQTLYLYEIQVHPEIQGKKVGSQLMKAFHALASKLDYCSMGDESKVSETLRQHCTCDYTALTVFSDNERALNWYKSMGYTYSPNSPRDRKTRLRTVKPDYYELQREVE